MRTDERSGGMAIGGAACVAVLLLALGRVPPAHAQARVCERYDVGARTPLLDQRRRRIFIDAPTAVRMGKDIAILGTQAILWRSETIFADTAGMIQEAQAGRYVDMDTVMGAIVHPNQLAQTIGKPKGMGKVRNIAAVSDGENGAWVVWLVASDTARYPHDVWIARLRDGAWSDIEHIGLIAHIVATSLAISDVSTGRYPLIALGGSDTGKFNHGVGVFRREGTAWRATWMMDVSSPLQLQIARLTASRLAIAFLGSSSPPRTLADSNGVFATESTDDGRSWAPLRMIDNNWNAVGNWPQLQVSDSSQMHLIWMTTHTGAARVSVIHALTTDGGQTWHRIEQQSHAPLRALASIPTLEGVAYIPQERDSDKLALVDLRMHEPPAVLPLPWQGAELPESASTLGDVKGSTLVTWGEKIRGAYPLFPYVVAPATVYAWLTPCSK